MSINNAIKITIDNNLLNEYNKFYFKTYPKRKKKPIDSPLHPSVNKWFILQRIQMNDLKQRWKDFMIWVVNYYDYQDLHIKKAIITYKFYYGNKRRQDNDNRTPKFTNDGLVESGMLEDDDYLHLNPLIIYGNYDKDNERMEIIIERLDL